MKKLRRIQFLLTIVAALCLIVYLAFFESDVVINRQKRNMCKAKSEAKEIEFSGVLTKKYRDKRDHMLEKVEISTKSTLFRHSFLANDVSSLFDKIVVGDSLVKKKNSLAITVYKNNTSTTYTLDYMCD